MVKKGARPNAGRYVCSWCGKDMGPAGTPEDSHGICPKCLETMLEEQAKKKEQRR